jgi:CheY-like chemotaxis protein
MDNMKRAIRELRAEIDELLPSPNKNKLNVLIIDDEVPNLTAFRSLFRREFNVYTASGMKDALNIVTDNKIDVVFCDYALPGTTGADILHEINKLQPNIKRIVLTAYDSKEHRAELLRKANTKHVIRKPYTFDEIIKSITHYNSHCIAC